MNCIFCDIVKKKTTSWIIFQDNYITAFFDYNPASKWHILIVPNEHYSDIFDTPYIILWQIISFAKKISKFYKKELWIKDLNIIQSNWKHAWQEVFHYHMHIVPRTKNDNVKLKWKTNEGLREDFDELQKAIVKWLKKKK